MITFGQHRSFRFFNFPVMVPTSLAMYLQSSHSFLQGRNQRQAMGRSPGSQKLNLKVKILDIMNKCIFRTWLELRPKSIFVTLYKIIAWQMKKAGYASGFLNLKIFFPRSQVFDGFTKPTFRRVTSTRQASRRQLVHNSVCGG